MTKAGITKYLNISNLLTILVIGFVIYTQAPVIYSNFDKENTTISSYQADVYSKSETILFPPNNKSIVIFWASWCAPCKFEMDRFKSAILDKDIPSKYIYAINPFESKKEIEKFITQNKYPFIFIQSNQSLIRQLGVKGTPTVLFLSKNRVKRLTTGISPLGILKAEWFLEE
jgi:thiol-disulfide isomerase/thioredoxin